MCGRYHIDKAAERALLEDTGLGPADTLGWREFLEKGAGDICPSQQAPVLTGEGGELHLELMTWGLLPPAGEEKREGKRRPSHQRQGGDGDGEADVPGQHKEQTVRDPCGTFL